MKIVVGEYHRLAPLTRITLARGSLWLGREGLLAIKHSTFLEKYQRIQYADIQAVIIRETYRRLLLGLLFGIPGWGALIIAVAIGGGGRIFFAIFAALFLLLFLMNLLKGSGAVAVAQTAVGRYPLPGLHRRGPIESVLPRLEARIREKQGEFPEETPPNHHGATASSGVSANVTDPSALPVRAETAPGETLKPSAPPPLPPKATTTWDLAIFFLLTLQALLITVRFPVDSITLDIILFFTALPALLLACLTAAKWKRLPPAMKGWLVAAFIHLAAIGIVFYIVAGVTYELTGEFERIRPEAGFPSALLHLVFIATAAITGAGGFLSAWASKSIPGTANQPPSTDAE